MERKIYTYCSLNNQDYLVGTLWTHIKGKNQTSSFKYSDEWLSNPLSFPIDPELYLNSSVIHSDKSLFGIFTDCSPDRWGRILMTRNEKNNARKENRNPRMLNDTDYLLLVNDYARQGALRFKLSPEDNFLDFSTVSIPPLIELPKLLSATKNFLKNKETSNELRLLLAPGSSLGGARPKASVINKNGSLCIAKFPKKDDTNDVVLWEAAALKLAELSGLKVPKWQLVKIDNKTILVIERFDRINNSRLPFMSAMTMLSAVDGDNSYSYADLADGIRQYCDNPQLNLEELWKRVLFSTCISNTDDHLRNHGFIMENGEWIISPVYDINPNIENTEFQSTSIINGDFSSSIDTAMDAAYYFEVTGDKVNKIYEEITNAVSKWKNIAAQLGISNLEISRMNEAFKFERNVFTPTL